MHPPLDRPHPDCENEIKALKECHAAGAWSKLSGRCNDLKVQMDQCFKHEKQRLLQEQNKDLPQQKLQEQEMIQIAFGKTQTFQEYLQQDKDYQREVQRKKDHGTQPSST